MKLDQYLEGLDFNKYEKEILVYLSMVHHSNANDIYKKTKVPKGRLYSIIGQLKEKGFVREIPTDPKGYQIKNIKASLKSYLAKEKREIKNKISQIDSITLQAKSFPLKKVPSVYSFSGRDEHLNALIYLRESAKKEIRQIAPLFVGSFSSNRANYLALQRGIKVRVIVRKVTSRNKKNIEEFIRLGGQVKVTDSEELISMMIKDKTEFIQGMEDYKNNEERLTVISKNKALLGVLEKYFEDIWNKGKSV